jgi:hypothetical protein
MLEPGRIAGPPFTPKRATLSVICGLPVRAVNLRKTGYGAHGPREQAPGIPRAEVFATECTGRAVVSSDATPIGSAPT